MDKSVKDFQSKFKHKFDMDIKETACDAFCDVLKKYGIEAYAEGRAD